MVNDRVRTVPLTKNEHATLWSLIDEHYNTEPPDLFNL